MQQTIVLCETNALAVTQTYQYNFLTELFELLTTCLNYHRSMKTQFRMRIGS